MSITNDNDELQDYTSQHPSDFKNKSLRPGRIIQEFREDKFPMDNKSSHVIGLYIYTKKQLTTILKVVRN